MLLVLLLAAFAFLNRTHLPAPRISSNASLNEKARWLGQALATRSPRDVLVLGSSMALNNVSAEEIENRLSVHGVINTGSWGLSLSQTGTLFPEMLRHVSPHVVILPVYHGDFRQDEPMAIEWEEFSRELAGLSQATLYWHNPDLWYYLKTFADQSSNRGLGDRTYYSLNYDASGAVLLGVDGFQRVEARWNRYQIERFSADDVTPASLASIGEIATLARSRGMVFCVVVCPLRPEAESTFAPRERAALWDRVRAATEARGGIFIDPRKSVALTDDDFADYCHLNRQGARKFTAAVAEAIKHSAAPDGSPASP